MVEERSGANRRLLWSALWLAIVLVATKAYYLGVPHPSGPTEVMDHLRSLAAISYGDLWFVAALWALASGGSWALRRWPTAVNAVPVAFVSLSALFCLYAVVN